MFTSFEHDGAGTYVFTSSSVDIPEGAETKTFNFFEGEVDQASTGRRRQELGEVADRDATSLHAACKPNASNSMARWNWRPALACQARRVRGEGPGSR